MLNGAKIKLRRMKTKIPSFSRNCRKSRVSDFALGGVSIEQSQQFHKMASLSFGYRLFIVVTAAVVEEILYRGYAIGIGQSLVGGILPATFLSIVVFTLSHFRWGLSHLLSVLWSALALSLLFVFTGNLFSCIAAHAAINGVGLLLLPSLAPKQGWAASRSKREG